jgi:hypothetical protein
MMRFQARIFPWIAAAALVFVACARVVAQSGAQGGNPTGSQSGSQSAPPNGAQNGSGNGSGNSSSQSSVAPPSEQAPSNTPYISVNPLANVTYDNRWDMSLEMAYQHIKAGPNVLQGANLGGLSLSGSYWLTKHWGLEGSGRAFAGTSGVGQPNALNIKGPFISEYFFTGGPEWLGPHNKHGALVAHVLAGGVYGDFEKDLRGQGAGYVAFYNNQIAPAVIMGGHFDLNRSEHWVFRVTPDAVLTHYGTNYGAKTSQFDINAAVSVGMEYKFTGRTR